MNLNVLIAGWSIVWSASLIAFSKWEGSSSFASLMLLKSNHLIYSKFFIYALPIYVFIVWVIGCAILILAHRAIKNFLD